MGSSSRNNGQQQWMQPQGPDKTMTKGLGAKGGSNKYYSNPAMVPATGGLVRPSTGPGGPPVGIGLNFVKPGRDDLAGAMGTGQFTPANPAANSNFNPYASFSNAAGNTYGGVPSAAVLNNPNSFYSRTNPLNPYFSHGRPAYPGASGN